MRKAQKKQIEDFIQLLELAHQEIEQAIEDKNIGIALDLLEQCQQGVIQIGELIENAEGEDCKTIPLLEEYCEIAYRIYQQVQNEQQMDAGKVHQELKHLLAQIADSVASDILVRIEAVFLPYKASMWDSLESVWQAAMEDPNCDAYVIPIPYYDKNPDGSFKQEHYEGDLYPDYVDIVKYDAFDFEAHQPDMIFIHNPYDDWNYVTSVHPFFYSKNLKKFTENLVYVPYYSTTGGMSEGQSQCSAYYHVDYIIMQAEKFRNFFAPDIPQEKLLPLGTPKFDRVIGACKNPPEPPVEWKSKMAGKKVYFYNTSLNGMLANTPAFLKKMEYVFRCFMNREDVCLLWRPHPLMESTFASMRAQYKSVYDALKKVFMENNLGIYDETPDITNTIALCDGYIGDAGSSVTSLFGIAGKPLFILDNNINTAPEAGDWRGAIIKTPTPYGDTAWMVTQGNKLYHSRDNNFKYEYYCDLNEYAGGNYYSQIITIGGKHYVCPASAQDILVVGEKGIDRKIELLHSTNHPGAFYGAISCKQYLFLLPYNYPAIVRYDTEKDEVQYFKDNLNVFIATVNGEKRVGGFCVQDGYLFVASPIDNRVLAIHGKSGRQQVLRMEKESTGGCVLLASDGADLWLMPYSGTVITRWNPFSGEMQQYDNCPSEMRCKNLLLGYECAEQPFAYPAFVDQYVYLPPRWGNMFVQLDKRTGEMKEWKPVLEMPEQIQNGYFVTGAKNTFIELSGSQVGKGYLLYSYMDRKLYDINFEDGKSKEIYIDFCIDELQEHAWGFAENSEWMGYICEENAFNSLQDFLNENITRSSFRREKQIEAFRKISENTDGTCGKCVYEFMQDKVLR